MEENP
ncbi:Protein of unknown function [Propionibacterium freudenreichii]